MTIKQKQCLLAYLGYYTGTIDGIWGRLSMEATKAFQAVYSLDADGIFGLATEKKILSVIATGELPQTPTQPAQSGEGADWWKNIRHFTRAEFACPCGRCGGFPVEPDRNLVELADDVREHFGAPAIPSSGVRCQAHNDELKGSVPNSYHVRGKALDFCIRGKSADTVLSYVKTLPVHYAYSIDGSYIHMDVK